jgi:phosphomannomutase/phosphoglucomutase
MIGKKDKNKARAGSGASGSPAAVQRNSQGVGVRGNAFRQLVYIGVAIVIIPATIGVTYLFFMAAPARHDALLQRVTEDYAAQQADLVHRAISTLGERVAAAAASRGTQQAMRDAGNSVDAASAVERALMPYFPEVTSLRVLPLSDLGTAEFDAGLSGLRNHIEVDLVRRVSNGEAAMPEAYEHEGRWLASLARVAKTAGAPGSQSVVLVTISAERLEELIAWFGPAPGGFTLRQRIYGNGVDRDVDIVSHGSGVPDRGAVAQVAESHWLVSFDPSQEFIDTLARATRPDYAVLGLAVLCGLAALALVVVRIRAVLGAEVARIGNAAEHRTPLLLDVPELLPLAQDLRRLGLRRQRAETTTPAVAEQQIAAGAGTALAGVEGPAAHDLPRAIFRAYDIRGVADRDLDDETVYRIGAAIGTMAGQMGEQNIALGYDGRASSGRIRGLIEKALLQSGRDVIDIGLVPTPLLYFATQRSEAGSGIMITGSHSPPEYNGLKIVLKGQTLAEGSIDKLRGLAETGRFSKGTGHMIQRSMVSSYLDEIVSDIAIAMPLKVVVDAGNGATSHIAPGLLEELGCDVVPMNCDVDGSFPNRSPDTSDERALAGLIETVKHEEADFGVAYDGDGDRLAIVSSSGRILRTDTLMMLFARDVVTRHPGADVVYDVKCSRHLAQLITGLGGRPVLWKTGHALMKQKMAETGALLGGEFSGHIFFGERWYGFDDGMYATGRLAEILSSQSLSLDDFIADLPQSESTPEILVPVPDDEKFELMTRFRETARFPTGKANDLDGLRVDFQDGWGLLRASNTGPALTARFEGNDEKSLEAIRSQFREQLASVAPDLDIPF